MGFLMYLGAIAVGVFILYYLQIMAKDTKKIQEQNNKIISLLEEIARNSKNSNDQ